MVSRECVVLSVPQMSYAGHVIGGVVATTEEQARKAAQAVVVCYEPRKPILSIQVGYRFCLIEKSNHKKQPQLFS